MFAVVLVRSIFFPFFRREVTRYAITEFLFEVFLPPAIDAVVRLIDHGDPRLRFGRQVNVQDIVRAVKLRSLGSRRNFPQANRSLIRIEGHDVVGILTEPKVINTAGGDPLAPESTLWEVENSDGALRGISVGLSRIDWAVRRQNDRAGVAIDTRAHDALLSRPKKRNLLAIGNAISMQPHLIRYHKDRLAIWRIIPIERFSRRWHIRLRRSIVMKIPNRKVSSARVVYEAG